LNDKATQRSRHLNTWRTATIHLDSVSSTHTHTHNRISCYTGQHSVYSRIHETSRYSNQTQHT